VATKSKGIGRGKGGGRPRKHPLPVSPKIDAAARKEVERLSKVATANGVLAPAADLVPEAYRTLKDIMETSPFPAPRVSAAKAIIELARAAEAEVREAAGLSSKKAQAQAAAEARVSAGGKFSAPPPPPGAMRGPDRMQ
jgi:hypothetical protein